MGAIIPFLAICLIFCWQHFAGVDGAVALSHHQLKLHLEWNKAAKSQEWEDWKHAFAKSDTNNAGHVHRVSQVCMGLLCIHDMRVRALCQCPMP